MHFKRLPKQFNWTKGHAILMFFFFFALYSTAQLQSKPTFKFTISVERPESHNYEIQFDISDVEKDTILLKMPNWMPGYYQFMNYSEDVKNISATLSGGETIPVVKNSDNSWQVVNATNKSISISYQVQTHKEFVANSYVDIERAYIIPTNSFMYVDGYLDYPATVRINNNKIWTSIATGLPESENTKSTFQSPNFDILYDSPILLGNLDSLTSFYVNGIEHRFLGYKLGNFDRNSFVEKLRRIVQSSVNVIGDIPYKNYTFIGIGPGQGGIEHLNNTTISFDGNQLNNEDHLMKVLNFLAHEYFHHYNVKRIRPFELGPFDYDEGSKTTMLWVSEGLTVYYEYLVVNRAQISDDKTLLRNFERHINHFENNPGKAFQSLVQSSFQTWSDGPFGNQGPEKGKTISYYQKGPIVGLLLDFAIRNATQNKKSLDDVMRYLYWEYYKNLNRGFTDAEFQQACENIAGTKLTSIFEYVYTTKPLDYKVYLGFAGLELKKVGENEKTYKIVPVDNPTYLQKEIYKGWIMGSN
ncbi:M61 family peptidase [Euzebyella marina]|uniref:M61 family peptidase n=1 Tax=Euzebyella marina TaxID=1761453 RepID=A0A3G2L7U6_9FLAO|nr:M61 family metallopeptidase [Euzebyella marina]AYN68231.1 M61 family peptidase [Euzebyella marina]